MKTHGICSVCNGELTLWASLKASSPSTIRCPQCKSKLRAGFPWSGFIYAVMIVVLIMVIFGGFGLFAFKNISPLKFFAVCGFLTFLWIVMEIGFRIILFTYATFVPGESYGCLTFIGAVVLFYVVLSFFISTSEQESTPLIVPTQLPVIEALTKYKSVNGNYPENIELLIPEHLKSLPDCYDSTFIADGAVARYHLNPKDGYYILICHNLGFSNTVYNSRDNRWTVLD